MSEAKDGQLAPLEDPVASPAKSETIVPSVEELQALIASMQEKARKAEQENQSLRQAFEAFQVQSQVAPLQSSSGYVPVDVANSASLAEGLRSIIGSHRQQDHFQLIVITHDEK